MAGEPMNPATKTFAASGGRRGDPGQPRLVPYHHHRRASAGPPGFIDYWGRVAGTMARARRWCEAHHRDLLASAG